MTSEDCRRSLLTYYCWSGGCKKAIQDMEKIRLLNKWFWAGCYRIEIISSAAKILKLLCACSTRHYCRFIYTAWQNGGLLGNTTLPLMSLVLEQKIYPILSKHSLYRKSIYWHYAFTVFYRALWNLSQPYHEFDASILANGSVTVFSVVFLNKKFNEVHICGDLECPFVDVTDWFIINYDPDWKSLTKITRNLTFLNIFMLILISDF